MISYLLEFWSCITFVFYEWLKKITGKLSTVRKLGGGSFHPSTVISAVKMAGQVGVEINKIVMMKIEQEESLGDNREKIGFL